MNAKEDRNIRVKKFNGEFQKEGINMKEKNKRFKTPTNNSTNQLQKHIVIEEIQ